MPCELSVRELDLRVHTYSDPKFFFSFITLYCKLILYIYHSLGNFYDFIISLFKLSNIYILSVQGYKLI